MYLHLKLFTLTPAWCVTVMFSIVSLTICVKGVNVNITLVFNGKVIVTMPPSNIEILTVVEVNFGVDLSEWNRMCFSC